MQGALSKKNLKPAKTTGKEILDLKVNYDQ